MNVTIVNNIDLKPVFDFIQDDKFWLDAAKEWERLIKDYVPEDTGDLKRKVKLRPGEIEYFAPYSRYIYFGKVMVDRNKKGGYTKNKGITWHSRHEKKVVTNKPLNLKNGYAEWDKRAIQEKKDLLLVQSMQRWIDRNL